MLIVRVATRADVPWLLQQLAEFDEFFGSARSLFPATLEAAEAKVSALVETQPFFIADDSELGPVGFIAGILAPHFLSDRMCLSELFWWVGPPFRCGRAGLLLLNHFVAYGKLHATEIIMTLEDTSPVNPDTLVRRGFRAKEMNYLLEVA